MTNREAMKIMKIEKECFTGECQKERSCCECDTPTDKDVVTAYKLAIAALEKQEAVKPKGIRQLDTGSKYGTCPRCNFHFVRWPVNYCKSCGQKLGWEEDAE